MKPRLRPLHQQVLVITGASSGIGLCTARMAAARGARLLLVARSTEALVRICQDLREAGGRAEFFPTDVARPGGLEEAAQAALRHWGRIDTWINNAGVSIFGRLESVPPEDLKRLFETNFWGTIHGSLAALPRLKESGGCLINVSGMAPESGSPLQGAAACAQAAIDQWTSTLRQELRLEGCPIGVSLVRPAHIATPYFENARSLLGDFEARPRAPIEPPERVARALLRCAETGQEEVLVGRPTPLERVLRSPRVDLDGNLFRPSPRTGHERSRTPLPAPARSRVGRGVALGALLAVAWLALRARGSRQQVGPGEAPADFPMHEHPRDWLETEVA